MHVRTAVETLSGSTADAMEFIMKNGNEEFAESLTTIKFVRYLNSLWDVFNTQRIRTDTTNFYKSALNPNNRNEIISFLNTVEEYIMSLKNLNPKTGEIIPVVESVWKTGFRGFVVNIISLTEMYSELVEDKKWVDYLATYRLSQDHLEMFFGKVRSMNGSSDNPTAVQFMSAYRKLLQNSDIKVSRDSNVKCIIPSNILTIPSSSHRSTLENDVNEHSSSPTSVTLPLNSDDALFQEWEEDLYLGDFSQEVNYLTDTRMDSGIAYAANIIEKRLRECKHIHCTDCLRVLNNNEKINDEVCVSIADGKPCLSTYRLCKLTDMALQTYINTSPNMKQRVYLDVVNNISFASLFVDFFDPQHDISHKHFIVKFIIDEYINKKCAYIAKQHTLKLQKKYLRNKLKKRVHFLHQ